jgi:hypothetical protein
MLNGADSLIEIYQLLFIVHYVESEMPQYSVIHILVEIDRFWQPCPFALFEPRNQIHGTVYFLHITLS